MIDFGNAQGSTTVINYSLPITDEDIIDLINSDFDNLIGNTEMVESQYAGDLESTDSITVDEFIKNHLSENQQRIVITHVIDKLIKISYRFNNLRND